MSRYEKRSICSCLVTQFSATKNKWFLFGKKKKENGNLTDGCGRMSTHLPPVRVGAFEEDEPLALGDGHHVVAALVRVAVEDDHRRLASLDGRLHGAPAATDATDAGLTPPEKTRQRERESTTSVASRALFLSFFLSIVVAVVVVWTSKKWRDLKVEMATVHQTASLKRPQPPPPKKTN